MCLRAIFAPAGQKTRYFPENMVFCAVLRKTDPSVVIPGARVAVYLSSEVSA
jgi:hypothetical protein